MQFKDRNLLYENGLIRLIYSLFECSFLLNQLGTIKC